jgi:hypothetical protein
MSFEALLTEKCTIQSKTSAQGQSGQVVFNWTDKATDVKTRMVAQKTPQVFGDLGNYTIASYKFYFLATTNISAADKIILDGEQYEVVIASKDSSKHHIEVGANKLSFD